MRYRCDPFPPGSFEGLRALTTQSYTEANVKNGVQYEFSSYQEAFAPNVPADFIVITGVNPVAIKGLGWQFDGDGFTSTIYQGPTYTGGTPQPYYNKNTRNPVIGTVQILGGVTVTNTGQQVSSTKVVIGSKETGNRVISTSISEAQGIETILAENSVFLFRRVSIDTAAQRVVSYATWYEGGLDLPQP